MGSKSVKEKKNTLDKNIYMKDFIHVFVNRVFLYIPGYIGIDYVDQVSLELTEIYLPPES